MAQTLAKKIYNFKVADVKKTLVKTFKQNKREATIADLIALTGLPKYQVEQTVKLVMDEYGGHCKVTESGEVLYYFPAGMRSKVHGFLPFLKRFFKGLGQVLLRIFVFLFKVWIMLMLVGYFIIFLALALLAIFALIAGSASSRSSSSSRSRSRSSGAGAFLVFRLLELFLRIFFWVNLTRTSQNKPGRPFYKSVFAFVFGDPDPNQDYSEKEKLKIISFIRSHKGIITIEEFMTFTGKNYSEAQEAINSYLVEFEGEPMVSEQGTLFYFFPELLRTKKIELLLEKDINPGETIFKQPIPFSQNKKKTNIAIFFFNSFNILFGLYFTIFSFIGSSPNAIGFLYYFTSELLHEVFYVNDPSGGIFIVLGLIPLAFSAIFFIIPLVRKIRLAKANEKIALENLKKKLFSDIFYQPVKFDNQRVSELATGFKPQIKILLQKELDRYAAEKQAEISQSPNNNLLYNFTALAREQQDMAHYRQKIDLSRYEVGKTVFDTNA